MKAVEEMKQKLIRHQDLLLWGATGVGKTVTQCSLAMQQAQQGRRVTILLPIATLPGQFLGELRNLGWPVSHTGVVADGREVNTDAPIVVAMAPTLRSRQRLLQKLSPDLTIVDEAHEQYFDKFVDAVRDGSWSSARWVWATATPWQLDPKRAYERISEDAVVRLFGSMREIIAAGFLVPPRIHAEGGLDANAIASLELTGADNLRAADAKLLKTDKFLEKCARIIWEHGRDCYRMAGLCSDIEQAEMFGRTWKRLHGQDVVIVNSRVPRGEWGDRMARWKSGEVWLMLSVGQVLTGFDWKPLDGLAWLRPTCSPNLWVQGCGRPARISPETGKTEALILDLVGNTSRSGLGHVLKVADRPPQLKPSKRKGEAPPDKVCPNCHTPTSNFTAVCPKCEFEFTVEQLELKGDEDAPFGEVPDPELQIAINKTRGKLKAAFTRWGNGGSLGDRNAIINKLIEQFPGESLAYLYQWLRGAVFRGERGAAAQCEFLRYLHACKQRSVTGWIPVQFSIEFGFKLKDHAEISGHQILGLPENASRDRVVGAYKAAMLNCYDPDAAKLLRWAYDRAIACYDPEFGTLLHWPSSRSAPSKPKLYRPQQ